jgi:hypothetical protein
MNTATEHDEFLRWFVEAKSPIDQLRALEEITRRYRRQHPFRYLVMAIRTWLRRTRVRQHHVQDLA